MRTAVSNSAFIREDSFPSVSQAAFWPAVTWTVLFQLSCGFYSSQSLPLLYF